MAECALCPGKTLTCETKIAIGVSHITSAVTQDQVPRHRVLICGETWIYGYDTAFAIKYFKGEAKKDFGRSVVEMVQDTDSKNHIK
jgi:hypothetical protein